MPLLDRVTRPADLRSLSPDELVQLADEIRDLLVEKVSRTGGHLGPNLGVVELTIALHRVFDSPHDPIVFDTGHQSYVHKILTGRHEDFDTLRQFGGLSGYPSRAESEHDWVESSHASASLSWAEGMAKAYRLTKNRRTVVGVIGDGALTGGMAWEALNNIAAQPDLPVVIVVNDNGRSYTPTVGGLAVHLAGLRTDRRYEPTLRFIKRTVSSAPVVGGRLYALLHAFKRGLKDWLAPQGMFSDLGLKYLGPIDGHDVGALETAFQQAKNFGGPVIVHCITQKGRGFKAAEENEEDHFHAVGKIDQLTGVPLVPVTHRTWTKAFSEHLVTLASANPAIVGVTAAMLHPTGLHELKRVYPDRVFDVGIAEQHAASSAAGMAAAGLHPVVAIYATFLNRAFDQLLMDIGLHGAGVTFVLDRAGITGPDGPSHHGMWDMSLAGLVPGLHLAAPRDERRLAEALTKATGIADAPSVIRFSKDPIPEEIPTVATRGAVDIVLLSPDPRVLVVGWGQFVGMAAEVGERLLQQGIGVTVVDPVWGLPVAPELLDLASEHELVVTMEDNGLAGGLGSRLALALGQRGVDVPVRTFGIPQEFVPHGPRDLLLESLGLTAQNIARVATEQLLRAEPTPAVPVETADQDPA